MPEYFLTDFFNEFSQNHCLNSSTSPDNTNMSKPEHTIFLHFQ